MNKYFLCTLLLLSLASLNAAAEDCITSPMSDSFSLLGEGSGTGSYLGVDINDVTADRVHDLKLKEEHGVEVTMVDQDAPAGKAGIKEHDVILTMNGTLIESGEQLRRMIHETPAGRTVTLGMSRDGQTVTLQVELGKHSRKNEWPPHVADGQFETPEMPEIPGMPGFGISPFNVIMVRTSTRSGLMFENLTPQLGEFFGVKGGHGVLVREVSKGSPAEKAGLRAGDVVVKVNSQPVHDCDDLVRWLRNGKSPSSAITIVREKREQTINVVLPERKESGELFDEESLWAPAVREQAKAAMQQAKVEIARLQPELKKAAAEWKLKRSDLEQMRKDLAKQMEELRREMQSAEF